MTTIFNKIRETNTPWVIAEIGVNHFDIAKRDGISPMDAARRMIEEAAGAGADAIKFQSYKADTIAAKESPAYWDLSEEPSTSQHALFSKYDSFGKDEYKQLAAICAEMNTTFLSTPFDFAAADYLDDLCPLFKVSSSDLTNWPFLKHIAQKGKPVVLSTGASHAEEIQDAIALLEAHGNGEIGVLHCILSYPTEYEDAHLRMIEHLIELFPSHAPGYSDHTRPDQNMTTLTMAWQLGARIIEKHFTLDKSLPGNDHYHAMDPHDLRRFITNVNSIEPILDSDISRLVAGDNKKRCVEAEQAARKFARRSIVTACAIRAGATITADALTFKRPGSGISPRDLESVIGKTAAANIPADTLITRDHLK